MCGICGINIEDRKVLSEMMKELEHRGPDDQAFFQSKGISMGMQRLKIIDLRKGLYPITNEDESVFLVFNGEIFNFREIRSKLEKEGHAFKTNCDAEVIVHLYEKKGIRFLNELNGFFAIALWDEEKKRLILARDRLGIKPLYYYYDKRGGKFAFASEIKAVLKSRFLDARVDKNSFLKFLEFRFVPGENTILEGIRRVEPGTWMVYDAANEELRKGRYWELSEKIEPKSEEWYSKKLRALLEDSVKKRLMSDVPLGAYLSGGIDSSTIVALMSKFQKDNVKTFTVGFGEGIENEFEYARKVSEHFGTEHHEIAVEEKDLSILPEMVWHLEEPIGDAATLPTYIISRFAKPKVTVVLAGEGSDEQFAGYDRYKIVLKARRTASLIPTKARRAVHATAKAVFGKHSNITRAFDIAKGRNLEEMFRSTISLFSRDEINVLTGAEPRKIKLMPSGFKAELNKMLAFDIKTLLPDDFFMKVDKMTMAHSLEERVPFLDHRITELSMRMPVQHKLKGNNEKHILKKAMKDLLPREIILRKKRGYNAPMDRWLGGSLQEIGRQLIEESEHGLYRKDYALKIFEKVRKAGRNYNMNWYNSQKAWSILIFEMWHKQFVNQEKIRFLF
ncbi:asparagine synthase (glutamine-hydrolyzing) [Candidatus Woesearchaeota archaeon]|nr:MAG: asparagine synthase (glutamine-hydrolyzing) [Candidatus Woesearchaeota archaeon]